LKHRETLFLKNLIYKRDERLKWFNGATTSNRTTFSRTTLRIMKGVDFIHCSFHTVLLWSVSSSCHSADLASVILPDVILPNFILPNVVAPVKDGKNSSYSIIILYGTYHFCSEHILIKLFRRNWHLYAIS
jgi:hypothetical protein